MQHSLFVDATTWTIASWKIAHVNQTPQKPEENETSPPQHIPIVSMNSDRLQLFFSGFCPGGSHQTTYLDDEQR